VQVQKPRTAVRLSPNDLGLHRVRKKKRASAGALKVQPKEEVLEDAGLWNPAERSVLGPRTCRFDIDQWSMPTVYAWPLRFALALGADSSPLRVFALPAISSDDRLHDTPETVRRGGYPLRATRSAHCFVPPSSSIRSAPGHGPASVMERTFSRRRLDNCTQGVKPLRGGRWAVNKEDSHACRTSSALYMPVLRC
jgi:hypothetical protein